MNFKWWQFFISIYYSKNRGFLRFLFLKNGGKNKKEPKNHHFSWNISVF